jgi:hypothetical protein
VVKDSKIKVEEKKNPNSLDQRLKEALAQSKTVEQPLKNNPSLQSL